jgi:hypothetical protein
MPVECARYTVCAADQFEGACSAPRRYDDGAHAGVGAAACAHSVTPASLAAPGVPATPTSDRVCVGLPNCTPAQCVARRVRGGGGVPLPHPPAGGRRYAVAPPGKPYMRGCAPLTVCGGGAIETLAPGRTSDRGCMESPWVWVGVTLALCVLVGGAGVLAWRRWCKRPVHYTNTAVGESAGVVTMAHEEEAAEAAATAAAAVEDDSAALHVRRAAPVVVAV